MWETIQLEIPNSKKLYLARSPPRSHVFLKCLPMYIKAQKMTNTGPLMNKSCAIIIIKGKKLP